MEKNEINIIKGNLEKIIFQQILTPIIKDEKIATKYLEILNQYLNQYLQFKLNPKKEQIFDFSESFKKINGYYVTKSRRKDIAEQTDKMVRIIDLLNNQSIKRLTHQLRTSKLLQSLIEEIYLKTPQTNWKQIFEYANKNPFIKSEYKNFILSKIKN